MGRDENNLGPKNRDEGTASGTQRTLGILFWIAAVCLAFTIIVGAIDGDLLHVGTFSVLGFFLIMQRAKLWGRSAAWRLVYYACIVVFCLLALLLFFRNLGPV